MASIELVKAPPHAREEYYFRRRPDYSTNTPGRAANRLRFGMAAHGTYGEKFDHEEGLPPAAVAVKNTAGQAPLVIPREIILEHPSVDVMKRAKVLGARIPVAKVVKMPKVVLRPSLPASSTGRTTDHPEE